MERNLEGRNNCGGEIEMAQKAVCALFVKELFKSMSEGEILMFSKKVLQAAEAVFGDDTTSDRGNMRGLFL